MGSGEGGHRLAMALEAEAGFQFVGHQLEVGRLLERDELFEEGDGFRRPVRPVVAARELGGEVGVFLEETSAQPVKMGATDLEVVGGIPGINRSRIELTEDLLEEQVGESFGELLFLIAPSQPDPCRLGRGVSSAFATLRPPQPLAQGTHNTDQSPVSF